MSLTPLAFGSERASGPLSLELLRRGGGRHQRLNALMKIAYLIGRVFESLPMQLNFLAQEELPDYLYPKVGLAVDRGAARSELVGSSRAPHGCGDLAGQPRWPGC